MDQGTMLSSSEVCDLAGISYRQLDYWTRTGHAPGESRRRTGSGNRRRWSERQAAVLAVMARLVETGARPSECAEVVAYLMKLPAPEWHGVLFLEPMTGSVSRRPGGPAGQFVRLDGYDPGD
jgi:DNA-binding transcriptional MerR regulator